MAPPRRAAGAKYSVEMRALITVSAVVAAWIATAGHPAAAQRIAAGPVPGCAPMPIHAGRIVPVTPRQASTLGAIVSGAQPGDVIVLADGTYRVSGDVVMNIRQPHVTLMSASRDASRVIVDGGADYAAREILQISASDVTVAHLTLRHGRDHLVHLFPGARADIGRITLFGLALADAGQQFLKSNTDGSEASFDTAHFVDHVTVACSSFTMSEAGRWYVPTNPSNRDYPCYTGGLDAHAAAGWVVSRNRFEGIYCEGDSLAEHAIHFWLGGRDQVIERNLIVNCARGIGLGLGEGVGVHERPYADRPHAADTQGRYTGNYDGVVRNNVIYADVAAFDTGISLEQAMGARVLHNTVVVTGAAKGDAIEYRFPNSLVEITNNLATSIRQRDGGRGIVSHNGLNPSLAIFVDPARGNFRLAQSASTAIGQGVPQTDAGLDMSGRAHDPVAPDLGAYAFRP
jgi:hypothetical protein